MNYFAYETFTDIDMVNMRVMYYISLEKNLELQEKIDLLERQLHYYKTVCKSRKIHHIAV
jgi:hypothetical protein